MRSKFDIPSLKVQCTFCIGANERDNPYDKSTQPKEHAVWHDAFWVVWEHCQLLGACTLKEETPEQRQFALLWRPFPRPFRLRVNDVVRLDDRLGRVIRVTECAAVVLINPRARAFKTRFDRQVRFQPSAVTVRISANAETEILNRGARKKHRHAPLERRAA